MGSWVDFPKEAPELLDAAHIKTDLSVIKADGSKVKWDGSNQDEMVGYALPTNATARNNFSNKNYLCPIGTSIIATYKNKGFTLTQTGGWE